MTGTSMVSGMVSGSSMVTGSSMMVTATTSRSFNKNWRRYQRIRSAENLLEKVVRTPQYFESDFRCRESHSSKDI